MGLRFRKSFKVAPGVRVNVGKKSVGVSVGGRSGHISVNSNGRKTIGASIPGTGISFSESLGSSNRDDHAKNSGDYNSDQNIHYSGGGASNGDPESPPPSNKKVLVSCIIFALLAVLFVFGFYWCYALYWFIRRRGEDKKKDVAVYALGILSALLLVGYASTSDSNPSGSAPDTEAVVTSTPEATPDPTVEPTPTATPEPTPEPNTSEMVDYIYYQAKNDVGSGVSDAKRDEAVEYIRANYPNYYTDNEVMEKTMYYGYWLEEAYEGNGASDPYATLGMNVYQAVKYVYRGAETVDAQSTQENLSQIAEDLAVLGISVSASGAAAQSNVPTEYSNALKQAGQYSNLMYMSKQGIYDQLVSEYGGQFSAEAAQYAIDNVQADWNANALETAKSYSDTMHMSKQGIYDQLISEYGEKFTAEEAQYAVDNLQADYNANALETAKSYQENMSMSPEAIRDQLTSEYGEKFTAEEADYAIANLPQ